MQITNNKNAYIAGSTLNKDYIIRDQAQEIIALKDEVSGLKTKLAMCNSYLSQAMDFVESLKVVFGLIKEGKNDNN